jgi:hypothetical protein
MVMGENKTLAIVGFPFGATLHASMICMHGNDKTTYPRFFPPPDAFSITTFGI